jgi:hypothetical protein
MKHGKRIEGCEPHCCTGAGAGNAIAIQNLSENTLMRVMAGLYARTSRAGVPANTKAIAFGLCFAASIAGLSAFHRWASTAVDAPIRTAPA